MDRMMMEVMMICQRMEAMVRACTWTSLCVCVREREKGGVIVQQQNLICHGLPLLHVRLVHGLGMNGNDTVLYGALLFVVDSGQVDPESLLPPEKRKRLLGYFGSARPEREEVQEINPPRAVDISGGFDDGDDDDIDLLIQEAKGNGVVNVESLLMDQDLPKMNGKLTSMPRPSYEVDMAKFMLERCARSNKSNDSEEDVSGEDFEDDEFLETIVNKRPTHSTRLAHDIKEQEEFEGDGTIDTQIAIRFIDKQHHEFRLIVSLGESFDYAFFKFKEHAIQQVGDVPFQCK